MTTSSTIKILGVPLSQPVRAVLWSCLAKRAPFAFQMKVPGAPGKMGTKSPDFLSKHPLGTVPVLEDGDFTLSESGAILCYLARKHGWTDLLPEDPRRHARVIEYLSWSQRNVREASTRLFGPYVRADLRPSAEDGDNWKAHGQAIVGKAVHLIEDHWLTRHTFIAGEEPTIADFSCYEEIAQLGPRFGDNFDFAAYPRVRAWMDAMAALPHHDAVHAALVTLGPLEPLSQLDKKQLGAKLAAATKDGMAAIDAARLANGE